MRCPKCHYLSFDPEPRCKNCGYSMALEPSDLRLTADDGDGDAPMDLALLPDTPRARETRTAEPSPRPVASAPRAPSAGEMPINPVTPVTPRGPFDAPAAEPSVSLEESGQDAASGGRATPMAIWDDDLPIARPEPAEELELTLRSAGDSHSPAPRRPAVPPHTTELPLFVRGLAAEDDDRSTRPVLEAPLITVPAEPRPPLAVRRPVAESGARARSTARKMGPLERDLLEDLQRLERADADRDPAADTADDVVPSDAAGTAPRLAAAAIDAAWLVGLCAAVVVVTLRWCDLSLAEIRQLPVLPTATFLLLVSLGYLLLFTAAGGQTIGKMIAGIRVAADDEGAGAVTIGQALYREVVAFPSVLALGAGFFPALMGDRRAFHDRVAQTRVVRA